MKIPYVDLSLQWKKEKNDLSPIINRVFEKGNYVIGKEVDIFEKNWSSFHHSMILLFLP